MYLSPEFALGFLVLFPLYWLLARHVAWQNSLLLVFSYAFYAGLDERMPVYLLAFSLTVFAFTRLIGASGGGWRRLWLGLGISCLVFYLASLKYYLPLRDFLAPYLAGNGLAAQALSLDLLVPVGVSFYTFQAIALLVACYRGQTDCVRPGLTETGLYLAFFPTVIAGPICRPEMMLPQLRAARTFQPLLPALGLVLRGLFKKLVIAHWLAATWVDPLFANPDDYNGIELLLGACAYSIQIYADFSGLTDLVTGIARLLGFRLADNFRLPYLADGPREFWHRWHISLSTWIRDYIYIPLGGSRCGRLRTELNLMAAMLLSGAWHGAGFNYIVWGGLHGLACMIASLTPQRLQLPRHLAIPATFAFVTFAWIFFRAPDLAQAFAYLQAIGNFATPLTLDVIGGIILLAAFFLVQFAAAWFQARDFAFLGRLVWPVQFAMLTFAAWLCIELGPSGIPDFIYARY
jgi:alginate O-acetyltransferase complex protein AlgI